MTFRKTCNDKPQNEKLEDNRILFPTFAGFLLQVKPACFSLYRQCELLFPCEAKEFDVVGSNVDVDGAIVVEPHNSGVKE